MVIDCDYSTGIKTEILKLQWNTHVHPLKLTHFESLARKLRYQALAKACLAAGTQVLLLGHHANDVAETILIRMCGGYLGAGLQGISRSGSIPECHGIYGVHSGQPRWIQAKFETNTSLAETQPVLIEDGGLKIYRPLLDFTKSEIRATCIENGLKWIEDKTNQDKTLTIRNTVRHLLSNDQLPQALQSKSLLRFAEERRIVELVRCPLYPKECYSGILELSTGIIKVKFVKYIQQIFDQTFAETRHRFTTSTKTVQLRFAASKLIRDLISSVSPLLTIRLQDISELVRMTFPFLFTDDDTMPNKQIDVTTVAKVSYRSYPDPDAREGGRIYEISRVPPTSKDILSTARVLLKETPERDSSYSWTSTDRVLFDNRYWIKLRYRKFNVTPLHRISVRFLTENDLVGVSKTMINSIELRKLQNVLKERAPGKIRYTLPAIVESYPFRNNNDEIEYAEKLLALPTLNWSGVGWKQWDKHVKRDSWTWDIRYKKINWDHEFHV